MSLHSFKTIPFRLARASLFSLCIAAPASWSAQTQISQSPLASSTSAQVKPNIMFIFDTSGSMDWEYMPDSLSNNQGDVGFKNHLCNMVYYNPGITYEPPKKADGTNFPNASFTAAYTNGYSNYPNTPSSGTVNLSTSFRSYSYESSQGAYYWQYTGTQTLVPDQGACNDSDSNPSGGSTRSATGGGTWQKIRVSSTSGPGNTDERTNFANWYQYYRNRLLMTKGAVSRAFNQLTDSYRVGMITIAPSNGNSGSIDSDQYVAIGDFNSTQRTSWFTRLFAQSSHSSTPLREALARVGRHYAGKTDGINQGMTGDPVQYSCQQNFAILATDGYWNTGDEVKGPVQMDGGTDVGQRDGVLAVTPRPLWDGASAATAVTYKTQSYSTSTSSGASCNNAIQRRDQQIQSRTAQYQTATTQSTNATFNIIVTNVNDNTRLSGVNVNGSDRLSGNPQFTTNNNGNRQTQLVNYIESNLTGGWQGVASGTCSGNNNPVSGCSNGARYVRVMAPSGSGTTIGSTPTLSWSSGSISYSVNYSNAGVAAGTTSSAATNSSSCTVGSTSTYSGNTASTSTCSIVSDTGWTDSASCSASNPAGGPTKSCQTTDTGWYHATACTAGSNGSGMTTSCNTGLSGRKFRVRTRTTVKTTINSTGVSTTDDQGNSSWEDYDGVCYAGGNNMPDDSTLPSTPPPTAECTSWPCTTSTVGGGSNNSLADVAQYYYSTDLRPGMDDNVPASGTGSEDDKATWQHMTTFTLGLGLAGELTYRSDYKTATDGDFNAIRSGTKLWPVPSSGNPSTLDDLWHAAVNGRGQFFSASDPNSVVDGLTTALSGVNARVSSAAAAATSNLEPVAGDNFAYTAKYKTLEWIGELEAHEIDLTTGEVLPAVTWSAQAQLDAKTKDLCDNRSIYLFRSGSTSPAANLVNFTWNTKVCDSSGSPTGSAATGLNAAEQAYFGLTQLQVLSQYSTMTDGSGTPATVNQRALAHGDKLVNFLRGQRGYEGYETNTEKYYRTRTHVLGDIVNAQPVYVRSPFASYNDTGYTSFKTSGTAATRAPMVYVAANDGMLHAFYAGSSASDPLGGQERWAFIPSMVLPNLYKLADNNYANNHIYSVDGTPTVGDFYDSNASAWKTMLVAGLRAGGKGYYALDVTDPGNPKGLWEFKWSDTCYDSATASTHYADCHVGYSFNNPLVTKLADGTWVVILTSGYNNVNSPVKTGDGLGYLYVLRAYDGKILYKIATTAGTAATPSGLNYINGMTDNGIANNTTLRVYGVDLLGNTWRFDINDTHDPAGREAALVGTAKTSAGIPQPISTKPEVTLKGSDVFVMVGTGKMLGSDDLTDTLQQSVYGFVDNLEEGPVYTDLRGSLKPLTMAQVGSGSTATRTISCTASPATCNVSAGWVIDLRDSGERISVDMRLQLGTLVFGTNVPETSACTIGGYSWLNFVNYTTGAEVASSSGAAVSQKLSDSLVVGLNIVRLPDGRTVVITTTSDAKQTTIGAPFDTPSPTGKRISWRELPQ